MDDRWFRLGDHGRYPARNNLSINVCSLPFTKYVPLSLAFFFEADEIYPRKIATQTIYKTPGKPTEISIFEMDNGKILAQTIDSTQIPTQFVNSNIGSFCRFVKAHADFTNRLISYDQLVIGQDYDLSFVQKIGRLVLNMRKIDSTALDDRDYWWPNTLDPIVFQLDR